MRTQKVFLASLVVVAALVAGEPASSQIWPQKPVRIVVPFAPGGNTDGIARLIAQPLGETFGQLFVVENRPGAAGAIAAEAVARAPADGQTLLMGTPSQIAIIPAMAKTPYDPVKDLAPISVVGPIRTSWSSMPACPPAISQNWRLTPVGSLTNWPMRPRCSAVSVTFQCCCFSSALGSK